MKKSSALTVTQLVALIIGCVGVALWSVPAALVVFAAVVIAAIEVR